MVKEECLPARLLRAGIGAMVTERPATIELVWSWTLWNVLEKQKDSNYSRTFKEPMDQKEGFSFNPFNRLTF
jgi:hypothetical protein